MSLAVQKNKSSEPEFDIPQHLVQHVAQQVIGGLYCIFFKNLLVKEGTVSGLSLINSLAAAILSFF